MEVDGGLTSSEAIAATRAAVEGIFRSANMPSPVTGRDETPLPDATRSSSTAGFKKLSRLSAAPAATTARLQAWPSSPESADRTASMMCRNASSPKAKDSAPLR